MHEQNKHQGGAGAGKKQMRREAREAGVSKGIRGSQGGKGSKASQCASVRKSKGERRGRSGEREGEREQRRKKWPLALCHALANGAKTETETCCYLNLDRTTKAPCASHVACKVG